MHLQGPLLPLHSPWEAHKSGTESRGLIKVQPFQSYSRPFSRAALAPELPKMRAEVLWGLVTV